MCLSTDAGEALLGLVFAHEAVEVEDLALLLPAEGPFADLRAYALRDAADLAYRAAVCFDVVGCRPE